MNSVVALHIRDSLQPVEDTLQYIVDKGPRVKHRILSFRKKFP
jgi:hypothetical protein